jgi:hypothetical protein
LWRLCGVFAKVKLGATLTHDVPRLVDHFFRREGDYVGTIQSVASLEFTAILAAGEVRVTDS